MDRAKLGRTFAERRPPDDLPRTGPMSCRWQAWRCLPESSWESSSSHRLSRRHRWRPSWPAIWPAVPTAKH